MSSQPAGAGGGALGVVAACTVVVGALVAEWIGQSASNLDVARVVRGALIGAAACLVAAIAWRATSIARRRRSALASPATRASRAAHASLAAHDSRAAHATLGAGPPIPPIPPAPLILLVVAAILIIVAWSLARLHLVAVDDVARLVPRTTEQDGPLARLRGTVLDQPTMSTRSGSMAAFDARPPRWRFHLDASSLVRWDGGAEPCRGHVVVGVSGQAPHVAPGDLIDVSGRLSGFAPRRNPGCFDGQAWARRERLSAALWVEDAQAIARHAGQNHTAPPQAETSRTDAIDSAARWLLRARAALRSLAEESLLHDLPATTTAETRALLLAMFLGQRQSDLADLEGAFRRTGAMHLVAISGFNLAVLAAAAMAVTRLRGHGPHGHAKTGPHRGPRLDVGPWLVIGLVSLYLCIVEAQPAVLRAGAMILLARLGEAFARHWTAHGIYCIAALVLLLQRPADIGNAGFQLSFAVVAALIWLAPILQRRWFGLLAADGATLRGVLWRRLALAIAAAAAAWLVATPLSLHHFGIVSPLAAPLSLVAVPLASALLVVGYAKMILTPFVPLSGLALGWPLAQLAEALASLIRAADAMPGSVIHLPPPGALWTLANLLAIVTAIAGPRLLLRRAAWLAVLGCALWSGRTLLPVGDGPALRLDMLAVGDGTCILVRSGRHAMLFDAGSTDVAIGERVVVPALRALGVRALDAIIVSHANLDHFDAVIEVVDAFEVGEVLITSQFLRLAEARADTAPGALRLMLASRGIQPTLIHAGDGRDWGCTRWRWLHPAPGDRPRRVNDTSQVILLEVGCRADSAQGLGGEAGASSIRVLLCGDIEQEAIATLDRRVPDLRADIVELPHHGSWREAAAEFVARLRPRLVLQSTGRRRLLDDRWPSVLAETGRLVTARDGACWVEVGREGRVRSGGWNSPGLQ